MLIGYCIDLSYYTHNLNCSSVSETENFLNSNTVLASFTVFEEYYYFSKQGAKTKNNTQDFGYQSSGFSNTTYAEYYFVTPNVM